MSGYDGWTRWARNMMHMVVCRLRHRASAPHVHLAVVFYTAGPRPRRGFGMGRGDPGGRKENSNDLFFCSRCACCMQCIRYPTQVRCRLVAEAEDGRSASRCSASPSLSRAHGPTHGLWEPPASSQRHEPHHQPSFSHHSDSAISHQNQKMMDERRTKTWSILLAFSTAPTALVSSFAPPRATTAPSIPCGPPRGRAPSALHAARRRGGAMARRRRTNNDGDGGGGGLGGPEASESSASEEADTGAGGGGGSGSIYSAPPLYDLAFGYRDYDDEVAFLLGAHDRYGYGPSASTKDDDGGGGPSLRVLELAAGPARHSLAALSRPASEVTSALALDLSEDMAAYGLENADRELGSPGTGGRRDDFSYVVGDVRSFAGDCIPEDGRFDAAWLLLGSMQHLLTNDDVLACLSSVSSVLEPGGTMVVELPHPRETFRMGECTRNGWTVPLVEESEGGEEIEYGELKVVWGDEDDAFDPVAQVRKFTVGLELTAHDGAGALPSDDAATSSLFARMDSEGRCRVREVVPMRLFTLQEVDALARCAGFEVAATYGALDEDVSMDDEDEAFRMVCVLRKASREDDDDEGEVTQI